MFFMRETRIRVQVELGICRSANLDNSNESSGRLVPKLTSQLDRLRIHPPTSSNTWLTNSLPSTYRSASPHG